MIFRFILKLEWNTKFFLRWLLIRNKGITFQALKLSSCSLLTQEHWRLNILKKISTFLVLLVHTRYRVVCFNLEFSFFQINCFCIFSNWASVLDGTSFTKATCTTFDITKVLKIKLYLQLLAVAFSTISIISQFLSYISYSFHHFLGFCYMKNESLVS